MWAWRLSHGFMMVLPAFFLVAVGVNGHADAPLPPARKYLETAHERLLKYVGPVKSVARLTELPPEVRKSSVPSTVKEWLLLAKAGELRTVYPADFQPEAETVASDIKVAKLFLVNCLTEQVSQGMAVKDYDSAASALAEIVALSAVNKYAEFALVHQFCHVQTRALKRLQLIAPKVSPEAAQRIKKTLQVAHGLEGSLTDVARHVQKLHVDFLAASEKTPLPIEVANSYQALAQATITPSLQTLAQLRTASRESYDDEFVKIGAAARIAMKSEGAYRVAMAQAVAALQSTR